MPPSAAVRSPRPRRPVRWRSAGRRPSWRHSSGRPSSAIRQRGKFLMIDLDRDPIVVNPMLTGRFQLAGPGVKQPSKTAVVLGFGPAASRGRFKPAAWTQGASWLPAADAAPEVRYRDPTQMGKVYLLPAGLDRAVPGSGAGRDRARCRRPGADPRGRGASGSSATRASSRTCCATSRSWRASATPTATRSCTRPSCCRSASARPWRARRSTPSMRPRAPRSPTRSRSCASRVPPTFETQVRDFLAVHMKGGQACPRCGTRITEVKAGGFVTSYCRGCQR